METRRFFLAVSPRGSGEEKFVFAGSAEDLAGAQRAVGDRNRQAVLETLQAANEPVATGQVVDLLKAAGIGMSKDTALKHIRALIEAGQAQQVGQGRTARYYALAVSPEAPSPANTWTGDA